MEARKLTVGLAVRNRGSRLYGKPMQNLDVESGVKILDNIILCLQSVECIDEIILAIAAGNDVSVFEEYAITNNLKTIVGDEEDVLSRLIQCGDKVRSSDIFRVTSESPFPSYDKIEQVWDYHCKKNSDATFYDDVVDGCGFEIIKLETLKESHRLGEARHRSELCTLFIRENIDRFKVSKFEAPKKLIRNDLRLTVDNPEDLIVCKAVYSNFKHLAPRIPLIKIIQFLDQNKDLIEMTKPFTEEGYKSMYNWDELS